MSEFFRPGQSQFSGASAAYNKATYHMIDAQLQAVGSQVRRLSRFDPGGPIDFDRIDRYGEMFGQQLRLQQARDALARWA